MITLKFYQIITLILFTSLTLAIISCSDSDRSSQREVVRFHSADYPGKWTNKADEHDVDIKVNSVNGKKVIAVQVPFAKLRNRRHYVEAILLVDASGKELQKKAFKTGYGEKGARFQVPEDFRETVFVVIKCNLHDMWEKEVDWQ